MISESPDLVSEIPSPKITKVIVRATEFINRASLLQIGASVITNWDSCYKSGQALLQNRVAITSCGKIYNKLGQVLQIRTIIRNWGITVTSIQVIINSLYNYFVKHLHVQNNVEIIIYQNTSHNKKLTLKMFRIVKQIKYQLTNICFKGESGFKLWFL